MSRFNLTSLFVGSVLGAGICLPVHAVEDFIFIGGDGENLAAYQKQLAESQIAGVQISYNWKKLEPVEGQYDFSLIESNLLDLKKHNKKLFVQVQERFFSPQARNIPLYLQRESQYGGGLTAQTDNPGYNQAPVSGWVANQWNPAVRKRYQALLQALAVKFDGEIYGINLPETAIDINSSKNNGFSCDKYFAATLENLGYAAKVFKHSYVVQYVNFFPCEWNNDRDYMGRLFAFAEENKIGLGGPDVIPYRKGQMKNSYPFFHQYRGKLPMVAMAVQEPDFSYINPKTGKHFSESEFSNFATDYLGAQIIFWDAGKYKPKPANPSTHYTR